MSNQKLVRCEVARSGQRETSIRYVPLELYAMWKFLMINKHSFEIRSEISSLWVEALQAAAVSPDKGRIERVTELRRFVLDGEQGMISEVCRYVPDKDLETVRGVQ